MKLKIKKLDARSRKIIDRLIEGFLLILMVLIMLATVLLTSLVPSSNDITQTPLFVIVNGIEY